MDIPVGFFHPACGLTSFKSAIFISINLCGQKVSFAFFVLEFPPLFLPSHSVDFFFFSLLHFRSSLPAFPVGANHCSKCVGTMTQTLPVIINSFERYSVAFIFLFLTKPCFLTFSCLPLCSSCKPFLRLACCPVMAVKTWLLFCSFPPHCFTSLVDLLLPYLAACVSKIRCMQLRHCLTYRGQFLECCGLRNSLGR